MKNKFSCLLIILIAGLSVNNLFSQEKTRDMILKAMQDELKRSMTSLSLENLKKPFFISYNIADAKTMAIKSTLGALTFSEERPRRGLSVRVLTGDYSKNNENFLDLSGFGRGGSFARGTDELPLDDDYNGIRRALWIATDEAYKTAAESFEKKMSAVKQQNLSQEDSLDDFSKAPITNLKYSGKKFAFDRPAWEKNANMISSVFSKFKDIFSSSVAVYFINADVYYINSESTVTIYPVSVAAIQVNASTQADDGEPLSDFATYFGVSPADFPPLDQIIKDVEKMAENLKTLREAPAVTDSYSGPVIFEGQAMAEIFAQRFFASGEGLVATRKPIYSDPKVLMFMSQMQPKSLDDKVDKKIISSEITIKSTPKVESFKGKNLIGSFKVDNDGIEPKDELVLVEKGVLKTLLNGRNPSLKVKESNGHERLIVGLGELASQIGPGVINVSVDNGQNITELKKKMLDKAKEDGLEYVYVVRKMRSSSSGAQEKFDVSSVMSMAMGGQKEGKVSKPVAVYRISVKDGKEELVRNVELGGITINSLKKIMGISSEQMVYNTMVQGKGGGDFSGFVFMFGDMVGSGWNLRGIPASFIVPNAMLLEEFEIKKESRALTQKLPIVENPVGR